MAAVSLLETIRRDMGEQGSESMGQVMFVGPCPICGRRNCASVDIGADRLACGYTRESYSLDQYLALVPHGQAAGPPEPPLPEEWDRWEPTPRLPPLVAVSASSPPPRSRPLVHGVLRRGHVALLSGKGKTGKSWCAIALSIAVAVGAEWFGHKVEQGSVLYIDPELDPRSLDNRFSAVAEAVGADKSEVDAHVSKWCLRGVPGATMGALAKELEREGCRFDLVVVDSCSYFVEGDENSSVDIRRLASRVLQVAAATGGAVFLVHHMGKGSPGDRDVSDRARGSSVWLDFPDAPLAITEVFPPSGEPSEYLGDGVRAFVLEDAGLREFPSIEPVHVVFDYPVHVLDEDGTTSDWKPKSGQKSGGQASGAANRAKSAGRAARCELAIAAEIIAKGLDGLAASEAAEACSEALGEAVKAATLKGYIEQSEVFKVEQVSPQRWRAVPIRLPPPKLEL